MPEFSGPGTPASLRPLHCAIRTRHLGAGWRSPGRDALRSANMATEHELLGRGLRALDVRADRRPREARSSPARTGFMVDMPAVGLIGSTTAARASPQAAPQPLPHQALW